MDPELICPQPGAIYMTVYYHNIQTSAPLKPLGQQFQILYEISMGGGGGVSVYINPRSHDQYGRHAQIL